MFRALPLFLSIAGIAACAAPQGSPPSLEKRPAEAIDPRLPVGSTPTYVQTPAIAAQIATIERSAQDGILAFEALRAPTGDLIANAGATNSESWVSAVQALSRLEAARRPLVDALADLDALVTDRDWVNPADRAAVQAAVAQLAPIDAAQAALIERWTARLQP